MLQVTQVSKEYRGKLVLDNVSFTLPGGRCLGVAGHNGSGKSTLLAIVAQVTRPSAGSVAYNGQGVLGNRAFLRGMVGYVPQQDSLLDDLTVQETLVFWQKSYGLAPGDLFAPGSPAHALGLAALSKKKVGTLSGGMKKRLSVALALLHSPQLLLLDEALPALDRHYRQTLHALIEAAKHRGACVLYCSHEVSELQGLCDDILVLQNGRPVFLGAASTFPQDAAALDAMMNPARPE